MNSFSINRFCQILCWVLRVNRRSLLAWTAGSVVAVLMGELVVDKMSIHGNPYSFLYEVSQLGIVILLLVSAIMPSTIVASINEKRKRESFLMLPATNLEKYLALMVYTSVICVISLILAFVLGDCLRMLWFWISPPEGAELVGYIDGQAYYWWSSALPILWDHFLPNVIANDPVYQYSTLFAVMQMVVIGSLVLWMHSLLILGGTLLRKYAFINISAFYLLTVTLFAKFMKYYELSMFTCSWEDGQYVAQEVGTIPYVLAVVLPLFAIFNYWASFRIFKGIQLITNKWINYDFHK